MSYECDALSAELRRRYEVTLPPAREDVNRRLGRAQAGSAAPPFFAAAVALSVSAAAPAAVLGAAVAPASSAAGRAAG